MYKCRCANISSFETFRGIYQLRRTTFPKTDYQRYIEMSSSWLTDVAYRPISRWLMCLMIRARKCQWCGKGVRRWWTKVYRLDFASVSKAVRKLRKMIFRFRCFYLTCGLFTLSRAYTFNLALWLYAQLNDVTAPCVGLHNNNNNNKRRIHGVTVTVTLFYLGYTSECRHIGEILRCRSVTP